MDASCIRKRERHLGREHRPAAVAGARRRDLGSRGIRPWCAGLVRSHRESQRLGKHVWCDGREQGKRGSGGIAAGRMRITPPGSPPKTPLADSGHGGAAGLLRPATPASMRQPRLEPAEPHRRGSAATAPCRTDAGPGGPAPGLVLRHESDRQEQKNLSIRLDRSGFGEPHTFEDFGWTRSSPGSSVRWRVQRSARPAASEPAGVFAIRIRRCQREHGRWSELRPAAHSLAHHGCGSRFPGKLLSPRASAGRSSQARLAIRPVSPLALRSEPEQEQEDQCQEGQRRHPDDDRPDAGQGNQQHKEGESDAEQHGTFRTPGPGRRE
jgi:hypothetical protein